MTDAPDYKDTVFLPKTDFPMKAGLPQKEPAILAGWQAGDIYAQTRAARAGREKFIFHDGPPYANGDMHIGHALNHILKDMVVRTQTLLGKDAPYVPGWDCHGLPIEWKVEEQYRKKKQDKDHVPLAEFRAECRAYAKGWVDVQREQLKRLGINGDWDKPYLTMDFDAEATIVAELMKFAESGQLYRGAKPVMWSPVEKTALAEAEIEYEDITSTQIDVAFEIVDSPIEELKGAYAVIWTTTPWTIPVNQAIAYGEDVEYVLVAYVAPRLIQTSQPGDERTSANFAERTKKYLVARSRLDHLKAGLARTASGQLGGVMMLPSQLMIEEVWSGTGNLLAGTIARHPMAKLFPGEGRGPEPDSEGLAALDPGLRRGTDEVELGLNPASPLAEFFLRPRPFLPGDFVTTDAGTGLVHMAPDHGEDDFDLCKAHGINPVFAVEGDGKYRADWAWLGGQGSVINPKFNAPDGPICTALREAGALLAASADFQHSYPHSWRSKAKLIYRCTPQWFVPMDRPIGSGDTLRHTALAAIADTRWVPAKGENRIRSMVDGRPDWVISRQRAWGVPITLFVDRKTGEYLVDPAVNARIVAAMRQQGVDAWTDANAAAFLGPDRDPADYERVTDILDVWFDSGCTHAFVLESGKWPELVTGGPADLYLEGSDQHRGWFQSSLMESCATRGRAPYKAVLTHGFTMASDGRKMSKSLGNTIDPVKVMETSGADIIRLWALSVDFTEDHRIGDEILKGTADQYRKLRNTFRYMLGALDGFGEGERVAVADMPELERYILHRLAALDADLRRAVDAFDFNSYVRALTDFMADDLSAFYFDIRKDSLYCDIGPAAPLGTDKRRAYRTVLDTLFHALIRYAAPVLVFTAEEVWGTRYPDGGSVHLLEWPEVDADWVDSDLAAAWSVLRDLRRLVTEAIEPLRRDKAIGSSLEAHVSIQVSAGNRFEAPVTGTVDFAELFIASAAQVDVGLIDTGVDIQSLAVTPTSHHKCGRCWRHLPEVTTDGALCGRCTSVLG